MPTMFDLESDLKDWWESLEKVLQTSQARVEEGRELAVTAQAANVNLLRARQRLLSLESDWNPPMGEPLAKRLASYDAWATGLRRAETHNRVIAPVVGWDEKKQKVKVSPLARWSDEDVEKYIAENGILVNPLQYDGYPSIGCWPCTQRVAEGEDPRSGRWVGSNKTECGIHQ